MGVSNIGRSKLANKIESDGYEIIESGSVVLFNKNGKLTFTIDNLCFEIEFKSGTEQGIKSSIDKNKNKFHMICTGFDNALGSSPSSPLHILNHNGYNIYFRFVAFNMNEIPYLIYTFYKGGKNE